MESAPGNDRAEVVRSYIASGYAVLPVWGVTAQGKCKCGSPGCRTPGKHPMSHLVPHGGKDASTIEAVVDRWLERNPTGNWGLRMGESKEGGYAITLDIDPRNGGDDSLVMLEREHGKLPVTKTQLTGGGGFHYVLRSKVPVDACVLAPGIDVKVSPGYIVCSPSVHASQRAYVWDVAYGFDTPIADVPEWLAKRLIEEKKPSDFSASTGEDSLKTMLGHAFWLSGWLGGRLPGGKRAVRCPWFNSHSDGRGDGKDNSTVLLPPTEKSHFGGFHCSHGHCEDRGWKDVLNALPPDALAQARLKYQPKEAPSPPPSSTAAPDGKGPCASDPLRGLAHLGPIAIIGRERIMELAAQPIVYLWQDIALAGIIVVIAGGPGCGKTTLLFLILAARLNRGPAVKVLGREVTPAPPGTFVVLIEGEHGDTSTARKLVKSARLLGVEQDGLERIIIVARSGVRIGSPAWEDVVRLVEAGLVSDIALDTLARVAPADANSEAEQVAIFERIAQAVEKAPEGALKPIVWVNTHMRKGEGKDLDDVSGSVQRTGQADTVLMVTAENKDGRVVSSTVTFRKLREDPEEHPAPFKYSVTSSGVVDIKAREKDDRPLEVRILEQLKLGPQTKNRLKEDLGRDVKDLEGPLSNLFAARKIRKVTVPLRGKQVNAFVIREDEWTP